MIEIITKDDRIKLIAKGSICVGKLILQSDLTWQLENCYLSKEEIEHLLKIWPNANRSVSK